MTIPGYMAALAKLALAHLCVKVITPFTGYGLYPAFALIVPLKSDTCKGLEDQVLGVDRNQCI